NGDEKTILHCSLADGLGLSSADDMYCIFRDEVTDLEYIRSNRQLRDEGMYAELGAYKRHVFTGFREVRDGAARHWSRLCEMLAGRGVGSVEAAARELALQPILRAMEAALDAPMLTGYVRGESVADGQDTAAAAEFEARTRQLLDEATREARGAFPPDDTVREAAGLLDALLALEPVPDPASAAEVPATADQAASPAATLSAAARIRRAALGAWLLLRGIGRVRGEAGRAPVWIEDWILRQPLRIAFGRWGLGADESELAMGLTLALAEHADGATAAKDARPIVEGLLREPETSAFLGINRADGVIWYRKERFEDLLGALRVASLGRIAAEPALTDADRAAETARVESLFDAVDAAKAASGWQVEPLLEALRAR
ncbi:MAG: hypothetical protein AB7P22_18245, partial [Vicinamibacterales bacterium]